MFSNMRKIFLITTILSMLLIGECLITNAYQNQIEKEPTPNLFHIGTVYVLINISKTEFIPNEFTVKESAKVNLTIRSIDVGHTFKIVEYGINKTIEANDSLTFEFVADKLGSFAYSSINCTQTGTMNVLDPYVPDLPRPEEIKVLFDLSHNSNKNSTKAKYTTIMNWVKNNKFVVTENNNSQVIATLLASIKVLIILEPQTNFTNFEIADIQSFIKEGGSLLIGGSAKTFKTNAFEITQPFGFTFSNASARFINSTNLSNPIGENNTLPTFIFSEFIDHPITNENQYVPLTDEIVTTIDYLGTTLNYNETWALESIVNDNLTDSGELIDSYIFARGNETIFADLNGDITVNENESRSENVTLIVATETTYNGRVFSIGSADVFNDTQVGRFPTNIILFQRALQWISKMYAIIQTQSFELSTYQVQRGDKINSSMAILAQNGTEIDSINSTLRIWRASRIEYSIYLSAINNTHFEGLIDTINITQGIVGVDIISHRRGYGYNVTNSIFIEIYPKNPVHLPVPIPYIITYIASILVGIIALFFFFIRVLKQPKITAAKEAAETLSKEKEKPTKADLEDYEVEETDKPKKSK